MDVDGFFDTQFKPLMSFVQYDNVFVLKRVLSCVEVGINGRVVDSLCAGSPMLVHTFMNRLFGFTFVCLLKSIVFSFLFFCFCLFFCFLLFALKAINDVNLNTSKKVTQLVFIRL